MKHVIAASVRWAGRGRLPILAALLVAVTGCGPSRGVVPVTGVAKLDDGTPVPRGLVFFVGNGVDGARGHIAPDGTFRLGTFTPTDGAKPGTYTAYVVGATEEDTRSQDEMSTKPPPPSLVHRKYDAAATSDLRVEVKPPKNHVELVFERAAPRGKSSPK